jgi:TctA family transporter
LQIAQGNYTTFFTRPISAAILTIAAIMLLAPPAIRWWQAKRLGQQPKSPPVPTLS